MAEVKISALQEGDYDNLDNVYIPGSEETSTTRKYKVTSLKDSLIDSMFSGFENYVDGRICCLYNWTSAQVEELRAEFSSAAGVTDVILSNTNSAIMLEVQSLTSAGLPATKTYAFPMASSAQAGILSAEDYSKFSENTEWTSGQIYDIAIEAIDDTVPEMLNEVITEDKFAPIDGSGHTRPASVQALTVESENTKKINVNLYTNFLDEEQTSSQVNKFTVELDDGLDFLPGSTADSIKISANQIAETANQATQIANTALNCALLGYPAEMKENIEALMGFDMSNYNAVSFIDPNNTGANSFTYNIYDPIAGKIYLLNNDTMQNLNITLNLVDENGDSLNTQFVIELPQAATILLIWRGVNSKILTLT